MPAGRAGIFYSSSIHRAASFAVTLQLCLRRPTFSVASEPRPLVRFHRNCRAYGNAATVAPRAYFFCCARKSRQKEAPETRYIARSRARFLFTPYSGAGLRPFRWLSVRMNVPHAISGRLHQFRFCSFPEYSANLVHALHLVGADAHIGPRSTHRFNGNLRRIRRFPNGPMCTRKG